MENLTALLGRFHPLLVHLPIGILFLASSFEVLSQLKKYKGLRAAIQPTLMIGSIAALASVVSGYFLSQEGGYEGRVLDLHRNLGIATAVFSIVLYFLCLKSRQFVNNDTKERIFRIALFVPLVVLLSVTGHLGGSLTHGEDYLAEFSSAPEVNKDPAFKIKSIANIPEAGVYPDIVQPVLEAKCYSCHSSKKQKGQLRLDGVDMILRGGKHGAVITTGNADSSTLFSRIMLPLEDEHHMPPNEKPQLSSAETDMIRLWINGGASFDKRVKGFQDSMRISQSIQLLKASTQQQSYLPTEPVSEADESAICELKATGALVMPAGVDNNYLTVSFVNNKSIDGEILKRLIPIKDQLISLRLSNTTIRDEDLLLLQQFEKLSRLYVDHTNITDRGAAYIEKLPNLHYLNLVGTPITDQALTSFVGLKELKEVYLFETNITTEGVKDFSLKCPSVQIDKGGYSLPRLASDTLVYKWKG